MYKKLVFLTSLVLLLGLTVAPALADDVNPPPWRGEPGSGYSIWTYDEAPPGPADYPRLDAPEESEFYPALPIDPEEPYPYHKEPPGNFWDRAIGEEWIVEDPPESGEYVPGWPGLPVETYLNTQLHLWGVYEWVPEYEGRTGVQAPFYFASWDIYNFWSQPPQPQKDFWIQVTTKPYTFTEGWYECPESEWDYFAWGDPEDTWMENSTLYAGGDAPLDPEDYYTMPMEGLGISVEYFPHDDCWEKWEALEYPTWYEAEMAPFEVIDLGDGWETWKFAFSIEGNPYLEFFEFYPYGPMGDIMEFGGGEYWFGVSESRIDEWPENWPEPMYTWTEDPDGIPDSGDEYEMGEIEVLIADWDPLWGDPMETWGGWFEMPLADWDYDFLGDPQETWEEGIRAEAVIAIDQIVIDTICVPEPATVLLLGLGGLALIRRRKRS